jgi:hypothetical protein
MRIGEIAIIGPHAEEKRAFISSISNSVKNISEKLTFGEYQINKQLILHLYGISIGEENVSISWDLLAPKLLGYIAIFRWGNVESFRKIQAMTNQLMNHYNPYVVVVGHHDDQFPKLPPAMQRGIPVEKSGVLTFCNVNDGESVKKVLLTLVDKIISQMI